MIIVNDLEKDALDKSNTIEIEKIKEEIKSNQLARIENLTKNNILHTDLNGTGNEDEITLKKEFTLEKEFT